MHSGEVHPQGHFESELFKPGAVCFCPRQKGVRRTGTWDRTQKIQAFMQEVTLLALRPSDAEALNAPITTQGRRAIAVNWKSPTLPTFSQWSVTLLKWGKAEAVALRREEARGLRKVPVPSDWDMYMQELHSYREQIQP
ncbi:hypothetical protein NDU88_002561 [Pleurodeles waltl]|uniref:Uncharacterized protein n=1 Tax=Pleurodeles waltl TaxID=8319 RepID=A0AAV7SDI4_PLEWA|nr:hypothetical protein NDU88_002561 [Pleurodeles waltl]